MINIISMEKVTERIVAMLPPSLLAQLDKERKFVPRSATIRLILEYVSREPGFISRLVGMYSVEVKTEIPVEATLASG